MLRRGNVASVALGAGVGSRHAWRRGGAASGLMWHRGGRAVSLWFRGHETTYLSMHFYHRMNMDFLILVILGREVNER